jgi:hypothetical protein
MTLSAITAHSLSIVLIGNQIAGYSRPPRRSGDRDEGIHIVQF